VRRGVRNLAVLSVGIILGTATVAVASHVFSDVPTSATYHAATEWLANRGITTGCAPGLYCPDEPVSRAQMALFMQRLGQALTPIVLPMVATGSSLDLDTGPVVCAFPLYYIPSFAQLAYLHASVSATGSGDYHARGVFSTNGGTTWSDAIPASNGAAVLGIAIENEPWPLSSTSFAFIAPGTPYSFGIRLSTGPSGSGFLADYNCALLVRLDNRNALISPLSERTGGRR
jgi:hypothetical protein